MLIKGIEIQWLDDVIGNKMAKTERKVVEERKDSKKECVQD